MALAETTLSAAVGQTDTSIKVASATSIAEGRLLLVDREWMKVSKAYVSGSTTVPVLRGRNSKQTTHVSSARVVHGDAADWAGPAEGEFVTLAGAPVRERVTYSASGAIALPSAGRDLIAVLTGTSVLTMTLADPTKDLDGCILYIVADGAAQHTVTSASGLGGAGGSYDVLTWNGSGTAMAALMACNELWLPINGITGTLTNAGTAIS